MEAYVVNPEEYESVIALFNNLNDNRTSVIAKRLNLSYHHTDYIINCYLKLKRNYMGGAVLFPYPSEVKYKKKYLKYLDN